MSGAYTHKGIIAGGNTGDQVARRAAAVDRVYHLLAGQHMSAQEIAIELNMNPRTVYGYLCQMKDEGYVRMTGKMDEHRRALWTQDPTGSQADTAAHARRAWVVPARQIGMPRDPLVAALFGPAHAGAAC